jgi:hypothetical protein
MQYYIELKKGVFAEGLLPVFDEEAIEHTSVEWLDENLPGFHKGCGGNFCHVLVKVGEHCYKKYCPMLFREVVGAKWQMKDIL